MTGFVQGHSAARSPAGAVGMGLTDLETACLCSPQNPCVETVIPNVTVIGDWAFEKKLIHEGKSSQDGVSALIRRDMRTGDFSFHLVKLLLVFSSIDNSC